MGRSGNNKAGLSEENKNLLLDSIIDGYNNNEIVIDKGNNIVLDNKHNVSINLETGNWLNSEAGQNKLNRRAYVEIKCDNKKVMCPDYTYVTILRALISNNLSLIDLLKNNYIVNHKNGDVQDCRDKNLEIIDDADNKLHAAMLHCVKVYFPEHVWEYKYMNGNKEMTQNILINREATVSVAHIKEFNIFIGNNKTCKVYRMSPINTLKNRQGEYRELPNKATISYFICWLRNNYNIDITPGLKVVDVVERVKQDKEIENYWKRKMEEKPEPVKPVVKQVINEEESWFDF